MIEGSGYVVGLFTLAIIIAGIAQGNNRSGMAWFILTLLLGPLALLLLFVVLFLDRC